MKRKCLISRLDEPNIAHLYVIESDQNLLNNIRVLCTKHPDTLRYFVPEELFLEIRNGEPAAMTAECYDEYGRRLFRVDPLKVLSEQISEQEFFPDEGADLDFRIRVEGYALPRPEGERAELLTRPERFRKKADSAGGRSRDSGRGAGSRGGTGSSGGGAYGRNGSGGGAGGQNGSGSSGRGRNAKPAEDPTFRKRKKSPVKAILLTLMIVAAAAGVWFMRDTSVKRFGEQMSSSHYMEAVTIYNEEILGHESREEKADPQVEQTVQSIRDGYLSERYSYEDACAYLNILTEIEKGDLSDMAQSALEDVELYRASSASLQDGIALMEEREYLKAIEAFLQIGESASVYGEAQENIKNCVGLLIRSTERPESEEQCLDNITMIDSAIKLLPGNEELAQCRETCQSQYHSLVRENAVTEADALAAEGNYGEAFARIDEGLEILPEDEVLTEKAASLRKTFVDNITREAVTKVDGGSFDDAYEFVEVALETYSCEELENLLEQIEEAENGAMPEVREYRAGKIIYTEYSGTLDKKTAMKEFTVNAAEGGACSFVFSKMDSKLKVQLLIKGPDGAEVVKMAGLVNGSEVNCNLEKGKTYTVQVALTEGQGNYVLRLGQQKAAADVSAYELISDSLEYKNQCNTYYFVPENNGGFRFDLTSSVKDLVFRMNIYDSLGGKIFGNDLAAGTGMTAEMTAGENYRIEIVQSGKNGDYAIAIGKPEPSAEITGKCIVPGAVTFTGQKKSYTFRAAESGEYRFTVGNMADGCSVKMYVYSQFGEKLAGADDLAGGGSVTAQLKEGQGYQIQLTQLRGSGEYTITMVKE